MQAKWSYFKNVPLLLWRSYIFSRTAIRKHAYYFDKIASFLQKDPHERLTELLIQLLLLLVYVSVDFLSSSKGSSSGQAVDLFLIPLISGISCTSEMPTCISYIVVVLCKIQPDRNIQNCPEQWPRTVYRLFMESSELSFLRSGWEWSPGLRHSRQNPVKSLWPFTYKQTNQHSTPGNAEPQLSALLGCRPSCLVFVRLHGKSREIRS